MVALTTADQRMLIVPVLLGLAGMVAVAWIGAAVQSYRSGGMRPMRVRPSAGRDPRSHVHPRRRPYDWSDDDQ